MSITLSPTKADYLTQVAEGLSDLPADDREEVLQDLEAHLAELDDESVQRALGKPKDFVHEFRQSAGLDREAEAGPGIMTRARQRIDDGGTRLSDLTHWPTVRPFWVWIRGWVLISAWSLVYYGEGFSRFPIPSIGNSTLAGLVLVIAATALSLWLEKDPVSRPKSIGTTVFSAFTGLGLLFTMANPYPTTTYEEIDPGIYIDRLSTAEGEAIDNIFAYDLDGNPVEVLLFDAAGRPLLTLPLHVYEDAEIPGNDPPDYGNGTVTFQRDQYGRIIPNLYPLEMTKYDDFGGLVPMQPPSLGIPTRGDETETDQPSVPTTLGGPME